MIIGYRQNNRRTPQHDHRHGIRLHRLQSDPHWPWYSHRWVLYHSPHPPRPQSPPPPVPIRPSIQLPRGAFHPPPFHVVVRLLSHQGAGGIPRSLSVLLLDSNAEVIPAELAPRVRHPVPKQPAPRRRMSSTDAPLAVVRLLSPAPPSNHILQTVVSYSHASIITAPLRHDILHNVVKLSKPV